MPVYLVRLKQTEPQVRLIDAPNAIAAERYATKDWVRTTKPSSKDLVELGKSGVSVETIPSDPPAAETEKAAE